MVAHCLLLETDRHGLVLVDTGIGTEDVADLGGRLGHGFVAVVRPRAERSRTALEQVRRLGHRPEDVRHVLVTHLDLDHAGGLPDFPHATVHVHSREHEAATLRSTLAERERYRACHFKHGPLWKTYDVLAGERFFGLPRVHALEGLPPEILAVPLHGHSRGHCAIAVQVDGHWLFHAGDGYFHEATVDPSRGKPGIAGRVFERAVAVDYRAVKENHARLRELAREHRHEVTVFSAHDPNEYARLAKGEKTAAIAA